MFLLTYTQAAEFSCIWTKICPHLLPSFLNIFYFFIPLRSGCPFLIWWVVYFNLFANYQIDPSDYYEVWSMLLQLCCWFTLWLLDARMYEVAVMDINVLELNEQRLSWFYQLKQHTYFLTNVHIQLSQLYNSSFIVLTLIHFINAL